MAPQLHLVVARHEEDVSWVERFPAWEPHIIQKGVDLPNEGREAASFFYAMQKLYDKRGVFAFVQGDPFPHCNNFDDKLIARSRFTWLGNPSYISEEDGTPWHHGLPVREFHERWIGVWPGKVLFAAGGQFIVTHNQIRSKPVELYAQLQAEMSIGENPWVMERLWGRFFQWT